MDAKTQCCVAPKKIFIQNEWCDAESGKTFSVVNPATEEVLAEVAEGDAHDIDRAVRAARQAFEKGAWPRLSARERGRILSQVASLIEKHSDVLAEMETRNNGKPISETKSVDIPFARETFEYYAGLADKIHGETLPVSGGFLNYTLREPVGVVGQIIPWNFPLVMAAWKLAPALATGCTVVLKPAEQTPLTALYLGKLMQEAGLPPGVVNIVPGFGETAGRALVQHPMVDKIAFTGSTDVGRLIMKMAAEPNLKRVSLELGGKAPNIVFADCDLEKAVAGIVRGIYFNQGEVCCAGSRLFVEEKIREPLLALLCKRAESLKVGDPLNPSTEMGAQVSREQFDKILGYIQKGKSEGAKLLAGGSRACERGYFLKPTLFSEVKDSMTIAREEIFGPVLSVLSFNDVDELIRRANDTIYGLSAGVWTRDIGKAHFMASQLRAGTVWVNCFNHFDVASPFGGMKDSGFGRELGTHALELYTSVKSVWVPMA